MVNGLISGYEGFSNLKDIIFQNQPAYRWIGIRLMNGLTGLSLELSSKSWITGQTPSVRPAGVFNPIIQ